MHTTDGRQRGQGHVVRLFGGALAALFVLVWASTSPTLSAWTSGAVNNNSNSVATGSLAFSHATAAGTCAQPARSAATLACAGSIASSTAATPYTDTITNTSSVPSSQVVQTVSLVSCGVVKLDNRSASADIMLPRNNTGFQNAGPLGTSSFGIAYDGVSAYASTPSSQVLPAPPALLTNGSATWGVGIWFKAASGAAGPLFSFGANTQAIATASQDDRTLYLNADGTLTYSATTAGTAASRVTTTNTTSYADNGWHFAYVRLGLNVVGQTVTLSVDAVGAPNATSLTQNVTTTPSFRGFWHLGWGSTALTGATKAFFTGQLSNFVVLSSTNALAQVPTQPSAANVSNQDSFNSWVAGTAVDHWTQADTGTASVTSPVCDQLDVAWTFANPAYTIPSGTLTSLVPAGASQVTATVPAATPGAASPQTSTTTITKNASYLPANAGLRVYLPWRIVEQFAGGAWPQTFSWAGSGSVVIAP